jgi:hypothetical protein
METLLTWTTLVVATQTARPGRRRSIEKTEKANAGV